MLRNNIVHPGKKAKGNKTVPSPPGGVIYEARNLGLWYIELSLLRLFGFQGRYASRVNKRPLRVGNVQFVPWRKEASE